MAERITEDKEGNLVIQTGLVETLTAIRSDQAAGFARVEQALTGKADKSDLSRMEDRLDQHGVQISELQSWRHDREVASNVHQQRDTREWTRRQKWGAAAASVFLVLATVFGPFIGTHL